MTTSTRTQLEYCLATVCQSWISVIVSICSKHPIDILLLVIFTNSTDEWENWKNSKYKRTVKKVKNFCFRKNRQNLKRFWCAGAYAIMLCLYEEKKEILVFVLSVYWCTQRKRSSERCSMDGIGGWMVNNQKTGEFLFVYEYAVYQHDFPSIFRSFISCVAA